MSDWLRNYGEIAAFCGVAEGTVFRWKRSHSGWPARKSRGWKRDAIDSFLESNSLGKFGKLGSSGNAGGDSGDSIGSLRAEHLREKIERERLAKETQAIELAAQMGTIVLAEDVESWHRALAATIVTTLETIPELVERELPEKPPESKEWPEIRGRVVNSATRIVRDAMALAEEFTHGETEDE